MNVVGSLVIILPSFVHSPKRNQENDQMTPSDQITQEQSPEQIQIQNVQNPWNQVSSLKTTTC